MPTLSGHSHLSPGAPPLILQLLLYFQNPVLSLLWLSLTRRRLVHCAYVLSSYSSDLPVLMTLPLHHRRSRNFFIFYIACPVYSQQNSTTHCFSAILCCPIFGVSSFILDHLYEIIGSCYHSHQHSSCYRPEPEQLKRKMIFL
ncbi:hypothetical protein EDC04DRAFT_947901 [Pisolithus marmoratus]|nr:hypothetical protein EDC04DRAFT_947901 [Pisolithus marmoratus]